jgi:hypothetical protein
VRIVADSQKKTTSKKQEAEMADVLFKKYVRSTIRTLGSTEFYNSFMNSIANAQNEFQFSNRRMEKIVDTEWVEMIEEVLASFQNIIENPRNVIREDELIVNIANARKTGSDVVRHLATHAALVEDFEEDTGYVRPNRVMQKYREDSIGQVYENRVVFTTLENAYQFVKIRHDALMEAMSDEFGAKLKFKTDMIGETETVHMDMFLHIRDIDSALATDDKNYEIFSRISRLYRILSNHMNSHFANHMAKYPRIKGPVTKTNVLKKNKNYRAVNQLLEYLRGYHEIGYTIKVIEQNPVVEESFQENIFRNTMFQYLLLKDHLDRDKDRRLPAPAKEKKRTLKPKFIKEIIEELTEDYDLPDVEIRKVLIEELTKEQLLREEAAERRRLVEERAAKKAEEKARQKQQALEEKEKRRQEKEAEKERLRLEKEAEEQRLYIERMEREQEDRRRSRLFKADIERFLKDFEDRLLERNTVTEQEQISADDFEDAAYVLEETERISKEQAAIRRRRRRDELDRLHRLEMEEKERLLAEAEAERERLRLAKIEEENRLKIQQEQQEAQARTEQMQKDRETIIVFLKDITAFNDAIANQILQRKMQERLQEELLKKVSEEKRKRQDAKNAPKKRLWRIGK